MALIYELRLLLLRATVNMASRLGQLIVTLKEGSEFYTTLLKLKCFMHRLHTRFTVYINLSQICLYKISKMMKAYIFIETKNVFKK